MALKRRDVILISIGCFFAWGYAVHWIPTLRWVGYAFVIGLVLPMIGLIALLLLTSRRIPYNERKNVRRPKAAAFLEPKLWKNEVAALRARQSYERQSLCEESQVISEALNEVLDLIARDFINCWYSSISKNSVFTNEVDKTIRVVLSNLRDRLMALDLTAVLIKNFVPILTAHLREFYNAERIVRGKYLNRTVTESEELDLAIAARYNDGILHPAASLSYSDTKLVQQDYLRTLVKGLLPHLLPESALASRTASVLINELVACSILSPIMQLLAEPDTWNQFMESYGRSMLQDRSTVRKIRFALDQHALPSPKVKRVISFQRLAPEDNEKKFEKFIRAIRKVNNLSDARHFRSKISSQLKKDSLHVKDSTYLKRLEISKRLLDQRVNELVAGGEKSNAFHDIPSYSSSKLENSSLIDLLHDTSGLTYFMEYMDRQNLMSLVQFWIVVDGFRTPLEDDFTDDDTSMALPQWTEADRTDLARIYDSYFSKTELKISDSSRQIVRAFLKAGKDATPRQYYLARKEVLRAQTSTLDVMQEKHFQNFKKSNLFYKCLTSQEAMKNQREISSSIMSSSSEVSLHRNNFPPRTSSAQFLHKKTPSNLKAPRNHFKRDNDHPRRNTSFVMAINSNSSDQNLYHGGVINTSFLLSDEDDFENEIMGNSIYSLDQEPNSNVPDKNVVKAMEAALNIIMEDKSNVEDLRQSLLVNDDSLQSHKPSQNNPSLNESFSLKQTELFGEKQEKFEKAQKPNISSLGLVNVSSRIGVFTDDDLFPDEEKFMSDEHDDPEEDKLDQDDQVHEAAPGDLGLAEAITALTLDIERLEAQDSVVDSMTRKAELTNNTAELRILKKSKTSLQREIRHKELQRRQYVIQESDNSLYGRSTIRITSILVGKEEDGREYAVYVVEINRKAGEQMPAATWTITRRYSEFLELHQKLREKYISIRNSNFPRRRVVMKLQADFLQKRRIALERYLREILLLPEVCRSRELRTFLSESANSQAGHYYENDENKKDRVTRLYNSITDGMEDILGSIPVLDQISVAGQNIISAASQQLMTMPVTVSEDPLNAAEAEAELNAFENKEIEPFIKPICDIFLEMFELNHGNSWLRGRAVVVVLHQLLGGTIERKVRENIKGLLCEDSIVRYISLMRDSLWPQGNFKIETKPRTPAEKQKSKSEASFMLATLIPDLAASVVGRVNAQAASRRISATLNNSRLNLHLVYTLLDEIINIIFNEQVFS
ncbi:putative intermediate filament protein [Golovinomyces cichoracearum]|uniref:Putative intermediate filament protein n=1 Tax=Golovinomyces cichoracearum TaxID=62708 RepID=A0A420IQK0_9PEZI|nr:putative intermediate filament protein [Golovinomyces cichoracearum]